MCGRINMSVDPRALVDEFRIAEVQWEHRPRYNVPPGTPLPILVERLTEDGELLRSLQTARWGLVPGWAKDEKIGSRAFNARSETAAEKPMFRRAFAARRCAVPITGYYEWEAAPGGKRPWMMSAADGSHLLLAGLFEFWRRPAEAPAGSPEHAQPASWLVTTSLLTAPAQGHLAQVHDRMPVVLDHDGAVQWIDAHGDRSHAERALASTLSDFSDETVIRHRVDPAVGDVRNGGAGLVVPVV